MSVNVDDLGTSQSYIATWYYKSLTGTNQRSVKVLVTEKISQEGKV
jgi:hypothetical protein